MSGDYLTKLRHKPKHVRDNIAFGVAGTFTALVALFLVFAVHGPKVVDGVAGGEDSPRFFETLTNQVKEQVAASRSSFEPQPKEEEPKPLTPEATLQGSGEPAPAVLTASSSVTVASTSARTVLIATTSSSTVNGR